MNGPTRDRAIKRDGMIIKYSETANENKVSPQNMTAKWNCTRLVGQLLLAAICFKLLAYSYIRLSFSYVSLQCAKLVYNFVSCFATMPCHLLFNKMYNCRRMDNNTKKVEEMRHKTKQNKCCNQHEI